jgi:hypothetical protein
MNVNEIEGHLLVALHQGHLANQTLFQALFVTPTPSTMKRLTEMVLANSITEGKSDSGSHTDSREKAAGDLTSMLSHHFCLKYLCTAGNSGGKEVPAAVTQNYDLMSFNVVKHGKKEGRDRRTLSLLSDKELKSKGKNSSGGELAFNIKILTVQYRDGSTPSTLLLLIKMKKKHLGPKALATEKTMFTVVTPGGEGNTGRRFKIVFYTEDATPSEIAEAINDHAIDAMNESREKEYDDFDPDNVQPHQFGILLLDGEHHQLMDALQRIKTDEMKAQKIHFVKGSGGSTGVNQPCDVSGMHRSIKAQNKKWDRESSRLRATRATLQKKGTCGALLAALGDDHDAGYKQSASVKSLVRQCKEQDFKPNKLDTMCLILSRLQTIIVAASTESIVALGWSLIGAGRSGYKTINALCVCSHYQEMDDTQR